MNYLIKCMAVLVSVAGMGGTALAADVPEPQPIATETTTPSTPSCVGASCCDLLTGMTGREQFKFLARHPYCDQPDHGGGSGQRQRPNSPA